MPRPDPHLLDPARYPFDTEVDVRFSDMDVNRHINNVSLSNFVEEGRVRFHRASGYISAISGIGSMVASVGIEYVGQAFYPGTLHLHAGASHLGRTSYTLDLLITQDNRPVVFARSVMVCTKEGKPHPIPDSFREAATGAWSVRA
ncbi:thioesterase family protein [Novosphingobium sp. TH158]|uniref:acyl-CoA thioesterase n=1 Tax=Novosphingobium sp. TH158 TaxID=2067455 RepID=UPI000C7E7251|nr:thioesterase family protein [Novosphingobium sp. TH158]PLK27228.1 thioesterase [Novosphingobium sp. TH158]